MNNTDARSTVQQSTEEVNKADVINIFKDICETEPGGSNFAKLGLAYYKNEDYYLAKESFEKALEYEPGNLEWEELWLLAKGNETGEAQVHVPEMIYFNKEDLLAKPVVPQNALPSNPPPIPPPNLGRRIAIFAGNAVGYIGSAVMGGATKLWGTLASYRDKVWTNWYRRSLFLGILTLAYMREKLNKNNLISTYPKGVLEGFQEEDQTPPEGVQHFRTADGSWNNLNNPKEGAAGTRFSRNVKLEAIKPESGQRLLTPNPREISRHLLTRNEEMKEVPFLNMLAAVWIQFQNHDWISHGENIVTDLIEIPMADEDPAAKKFWQTKMFVPRTQPDPTRQKEGEAPATFINEVTHWWDASQIYGSDQQTTNRLRSFIDGKLRITNDGKLPLDKKGIEETGFVRNWWVGLSMLHTLFVKEHNAICDDLKKHNPGWDDNRLFNVARLINAAITAKIHSVEWTPAILANQGLDMGLNANWYGILTNLFRKGKTRKTLAPINVRNPELGGVVGNPINKHGVPYALSQEFVEVYRLHSLLPEKLHIKKIGEKDAMAEVPFIEVRQAGSGKMTAKTSFADLFYSFGTQHPGQLVLNNFPKFMQELSIPFNPVYDLGAVDILRARERGVPRYNEFRRQLGLNPITKFEDLTDDAATVKKLKAVYGDDNVEDLDLLVGTLGEGHRPNGFGFGETMFQIFILNATRRLQADRFYTDCYTEEYYTKEGLEWIDNTDFKAVLLRHHPELENTGLGNIKNAFEPWDEDESLDPSRHPLRKWDKELKKSPWAGGAFK